MDIEKLTIGEVRELSRMIGCGGGQTSKSHSFVIGEIYLVQTATHCFSGRLVAITDTDLVLDDAAWIADTGRFADALKDASKLHEVEPIPGAYIVSRGAVIGVTRPEWSEPPREQK
ncbi:MAG: hypothetical protein GY854_30265 [Deltaproteobacteria bacterium]|nr:hypothetical protein [Deltaproteobacteria bacterium]